MVRGSHCLNKQPLKSNGMPGLAEQCHSLPRSNKMSKEQKTNKETKKKALLTPKEKKAAKQTKKDGKAGSTF
jgi:hypothetical protein